MPGGSASGPAWRCRSQGSGGLPLHHATERRGSETLAARVRAPPTLKPSATGPAHRTASCGSVASSRRQGPAPARVPGFGFPGSGSRIPCTTRCPTGLFLPTIAAGPLASPGRSGTERPASSLRTSRIAGLASSSDPKTRVVPDALDVALEGRRPDDGIHRSDKGARERMLASGHGSPGIQASGPSPARPTIRRQGRVRTLPCCAGLESPSTAAGAARLSDRVAAFLVAWPPCGSCDRFDNPTRRHAVPADRPGGTRCRLIAHPRNMTGGAST